MPSSGFAQTLGPDFAANYSIVDVGFPTGVPSPLGGLTVDPSDTDFLLIGGSANNSAGAVYRVQLRRNQCHEVVGFQGTPVLHSSAPYIDGGLVVTSDGVTLSSRYPFNGVNMTVSGSTTPNRIVDLDPLGVLGSTGAIAIVPQGFPGEGRFKIASYASSRFYDSTLVPDGLGTYDITGVTETAAISGGLEGIAYVPPGSPAFPVPSVLMTEYGNGMIAAYEVDAQGNPIPSTRRTFISNLSGAEGATIDPVTGNFLFSTFGGGGRVIAVRGFAVQRTCDSIDFNADGLFPDTADIDDFLGVFGGGSCSNEPNCGDLDFNNDCLFPDTSDIDSMLSVFAGGPCL